MSAIEDAREKAATIRQEVKDKEEADKRAIDQIKAQSKEKALATVQVHGLSVPQDVADIYRQSATLGSENVAQMSMPILKVIEPLTQLPEGVPQEIGSFYHVPTQEILKNPQVSILTVSRGFYALNKNGIPAFNQIVGGIILESMKPFFMYMTGGKLNNLWNELGKVVAPYTKSKTMPIPMFAFKVNLTTEKVKYDKGSAHVIHFELATIETGVFDLVADRTLVKILRNGVASMNETIESFIAQKEVDKISGKFLKDQLLDAKPKTVYATDSNNFSEVDAAGIEPEVTAAEDISDKMPWDE